MIVGACRGQSLVELAQMLAPSRFGRRRAVDWERQCLELSLQLGALALRERLASAYSEAGQGVQVEPASAVACGQDGLDLIEVQGEAPPATRFGQPLEGDNNGAAVL